MATIRDLYNKIYTATGTGVSYVRNIATRNRYTKAGAIVILGAVLYSGASFMGWVPSPFSDSAEQAPQNEKRQINATPQTNIAHLISPADTTGADAQDENMPEWAKRALPVKAVEGKSNTQLESLVRD
jgi:hypothetical protein